MRGYQIAQQLANLSMDTNASDARQRVLAEILGCAREMTPGKHPIDLDVFLGQLNCDGLFTEQPDRMAAWLENQSRVGIGFAYHRAAVDNPSAPEVTAAGIDGDAVARAFAIKSYGERWLASLDWADLDNVETTDQNIYFEGEGIELYANWNVSGNFWLVGGGNWLSPDDGETGVGDYEVQYGIMGLHYTFDSFRRMIYIEWRDDHGTLASGRSRDNEVTFGVRWDFGD